MLSSELRKERNRNAPAALVVAVAFLAGASVAGAGTIVTETVSSWNGTNQVGSFGENNTATYGQVIVAPASAISIDSFTFYLDDSLNPDFVDFEAFISAWDGSKAVGPTLYQSLPMVTTNNGGAGGFEAITVDTGGVSIAPGVSYVLYLSASNLFDGSLGTASWGTINHGGFSPDVYSAGNFVFMNNGNDFGLLTTQTWAQRTGDVAFSASFSDGVVPEPSTALLVGLGLSGLAVRKHSGRAA